MGDSEFYNRINAAIGAHGKWKFRLRQEVARGTAGALVQEAGDHQNCAFGTWLRSLTPAQKSEPEAVEAARLHQQFHRCASQVATECGKGNSEKASAMIDGEFSEASKTLTGAMTRWKLKTMANAA